MEAIFFLAPFVLAGIAVLFVAFSGGPGRAREAYLTRGRGAARVIFPVIFIGLGIAVPALVIAGRGEALGSRGSLASSEPTAQAERGKELFRQTCASCHSLAAANARGVTGPSLDQLGDLPPDRVLTAIEIGGTGQDRMPPQLLEGENAEAVAEYVSSVAGR